jgi:lysophospholipase L1-like esterase
MWDRASSVLASLALCSACTEPPIVDGGSSETGGTDAETQIGDATDDSSTASTGTVSGDGDATTGDGDGDGDGDGALGPAAACFADAYVNGWLDFGPDYDQFDPIVGSHCLGTNHQDITGVERVVFVGDSVTVGTPPWTQMDFYRSTVADVARDRFGVQFGMGFLQDEWSWKMYDPFNGTSITRDSGDFSNCSRWGARTDDFLTGGNQFQDCFPPETRDLKTLVVMTIGGNDLQSLTGDAIDGADMATLWASTMQYVDFYREAIEWLTDPAVFPNGTYVLSTNVYEFTDGTGEVEACDVSALAGFDQPIPAPDELADMVVWANEQMLQIAVETGTDMIFLLEHFCGHGYNADNPAAPCYRGPNTPRWFDLTCTHPNPEGHDQLAAMFTAVLDE